MGKGDIMEGWKISQVERLIDLPRRDIQRACYAGKGGAAILSPANSKWGRRLYDTEDLARLLLVKLYKSQGYSLPEIKEILDGKSSRKETRHLLGIQAARLQEQLEEIQLQRNRAQLLANALGTDAKGVRTESESYIRHEIARDFLKKDGDFETFETDESDAFPAFLEHLLDTPGIDLAIDLWAGPGSYDALCEAIWERGPQASDIQKTDGKDSK